VGLDWHCRRKRFCYFYCCLSCLLPRPPVRFSGFPNSLPPIVLSRVASFLWPCFWALQLALVWASLATRKPWVQQYPPRSRRCLPLTHAVLWLLSRLLLVLVLVPELLPRSFDFRVAIFWSPELSWAVRSAMALVSCPIVVQSADMAVAIFASASVVASFSACRLSLVWRAALAL
jgi:hypothetical protein